MNALPEGLNIGELLADIKKLITTVRKQGRRIAEFEQAAQRRRIAQQQAFTTEF